MTADTKKQPANGRMVCSWCGKDLGPSGTVDESNGICPKCFERVFKPKARR